MDENNNNKKTPLIITANNPAYTKFGETFNEINSMKENLLNNVKEELEKGMNELEEKQKTNWKLVEAKLVEDNLVDNPDVDMSFSNGVIYLEPENSDKGIPSGLIKLLNLLH